MKYVIFDIDGTLTQSTGFDADCYKRAVLQHANVIFKDDWGDYRHVTDSGILAEILSTLSPEHQAPQLRSRIKETFIDNIALHLNESAVKPIAGAEAFMSQLLSDEDYLVGIATGGWSETAKLKLSSAGITTHAAPICSANDAEARKGIMQLASSHMNIPPDSTVTYFGDASWDKKACAELGWNFVAVGGRVSHHQSIQDFNDMELALSFLRD
jgi:beta-phosphoglucomutase-like phosphatase (HAD superfamily)